MQPTVTSGTLTEVHKKLAILLADPDDARSIRAKTASIGIDRSTYYRLMAKPHFLTYLNSLVPATFEKKKIAIVKTLLKRAENGDTKCMEMYLKIVGLYSDKPITITNNYTQLNSFADSELVNMVQTLKQFNHTSQQLAHTPESIENITPLTTNPLAEKNDNSNLFIDNPITTEPNEIKNFNKDIKTRRKKKGDNKSGKDCGKSGKGRNKSGKSRNKSGKDCNKSGKDRNKSGKGCNESGKGCNKSGIQGGDGLIKVRKSRKASKIKVIKATSGKNQKIT